MMLKLSAVAVVVLWWFSPGHADARGLVFPMGVLALLAGLEGAQREGARMRTMAKAGEPASEVGPWQVVRGMGAVQVGVFYVLLAGLLTAGQMTREAQCAADGRCVSCGAAVKEAGEVKGPELVMGKTGAGCGSGGGCGTTGGCGSGGCGAGGCGSGCGGGKKVAAQSAAPMRPVSRPQVATGRPAPRAPEPGTRKRMLSSGLAPVDPSATPTPGPLGTGGPAGAVE